MTTDPQIIANACALICIGSAMKRKADDPDTPPGETTLWDYAGNAYCELGEAILAGDAALATACAARIEKLVEGLSLLGGTWTNKDKQ